LVPNEQILDAELAARHLRRAEMADWRSDERVRALYAECIARRLAAVSPTEQVRKFVLLERPFAPETGELTPTLKLRRGVICSRYADVIESMY
jgi:long-chain acyl-CoA synthetase